MNRKQILAAWLISKRHATPSWSMSDVAKITGISPQVLSRWLGTPDAGMSEESINAVDKFLLEQGLVRGHELTQSGLALVCKFGIVGGVDVD